MTDTEDETVTLTAEEYWQLMRAFHKLTCLNLAGVDTWERYPYALEIWKEEGFDKEYGEMT